MLYIYSPSFCWHTPTPKIQKRLSRPLVQNGFFLFSHGFPAFLHLVIMGYQPGSLPGWEFPGSLDPKIAARPNTPRRQRLFQEASLTEIRPHCIWNWPVIIYILVGLSPHVLSFEKPVVNAIGYGDAYQLTGIYIHILAIGRIQHD